MKIVVLVKQVPDTWGDRHIDLASGRLVRSESSPVFDEIGERALEVALIQKDTGNAEVVALTMGPASSRDVLRRALAMGADAAIHLLDDRLEGSDLGWTAEILSAAIRHTGFDLVVAGNESTDGQGGVIGAMIAEHLRVPHLTSLRSVEISAEVVSGERETEYGIFEAHATMPAVISVTERAAEPRFPSFKGIMSAKRKGVEILTLSDLGLDVEALAENGRSVVHSVSERPARSAGMKIVDDGNAALKLADFLLANRLI